MAVTLATLPGVDLAWACIGPISPPPLPPAARTVGPVVGLSPWGETQRFGRSLRHAGAWWLPPGARPALPPALSPAQRWHRREELCSSEATADWRPNGGVDRPPGMLVLEAASFDRTPYHIDYAIGQHLHGVVSALSGVDYEVLIDGVVTAPLPVACIAGGVALACALRPPGAGEVIPEEAHAILLKLDGCGTGVCLQGTAGDTPAPRGSEHFQAALHRCLQGDHHTNGAIPPPEGLGPFSPMPRELGLGYFSSSSAAAGEPRLQPAGGVVFTCNGRGVRFHKEPNAEGRGLEAVLPGVPFIGMFAGGEFGPGDNYLLQPGGDVPGGMPADAGHSYSTATQPHGLPHVFQHSFCSSVAMFG